MSSKLITYSLLAHVHESDQGIKDLSQIFLPLLKKVIYSMWDCENVNSGKVSEIQKNFKELFEVNIPFPVLRNLLKKIPEVEVFNDEYYQINNPSDFFNSLEQAFDEKSEKISLIIEEYKGFLSRKKSNESEYDLFKFFDANRLDLSQYFKSRESNASDLQNKKDYIIQAEFLESCKKRSKLFGIIKDIYLGSIITGYLEYETDSKEIKKKVELLLDTNFIISLLNLGSKSSCETCQQIVQICLTQGYSVSILKDTLRETKALIERKFRDYEASNFSFEAYNKSSITNAFYRENIKSPDIAEIIDSMEQDLIDRFKATIIPSNLFEAEVKSSELYEDLSKRQYNPDGALHDAMSLFYVNRQRKEKPERIQDVTCWWVSNSEYERKKLHKGSRYIPETIHADELISILWLTTPGVGSGAFGSALSSIITEALQSTLPKTEVLRAFGKNVEKYCQKDLTDGSIVLLGKVVSEKTNESLVEINELAEEDPEKFVSEVLAEVENLKEEEIRKDEKISGLKRELSSLSELKNNEISSLQTQLKNQGDAHESFKKETELNLINIKRGEKIKELELVDGVYSSKSRLIRISFGIISLLVVFVAAYFLKIKVVDNWSESEPYVWYGAIILSLFCLSIFIVNSCFRNKATRLIKFLDTPFWICSKINKHFDSSMKRDDEYKSLSSEIEIIDQKISEIQTAIDGLNEDEIA